MCSVCLSSSVFRTNGWFMVSLLNCLGKQREASVAIIDPVRFPRISTFSICRWSRTAITSGLRLIFIAKLVRTNR